MKWNFLRGVGNQHLDVSRMLWALSVLAAIIYAGVHLVLHAAFSPVEFGTGMAALLAGGGVATAAKDIGVAKAATANAKTGEPPATSPAPAPE